MSESLVGFSHLVDIVTLLNRCAGAIGSVHDLSSQALAHGVLAAVAAVQSQPAQTQGLTTVGANFDGHLIGGTTDAASLQLTAGMMFSIACWKTSRPFLPVLFSTISKAP